MRLEDLGVFNREDDRLIWDTTEKLVAKCMRDAGYDYIIEDYPSGGNRALMMSLYPPQDLLEQYGYDWTIAGQSTPPPDPPNASNPDPAFHRALNDPGGCVASTFAATKRQEFVDILGVIDQAAADIRQRAVADHRYLAATTRWSACMAGHGYDMATPLDQKKVLEKNDPRSPEMIAVALTDYACQRSVQLAETARDVRAELNARWMDDNPGTVEALRAAKAAVIEVCKQLSAQG